MYLVRVSRPVTDSKFGTAVACSEATPVVLCLKRSLVRRSKRCDGENWALRRSLEQVHQAESLPVGGPEESRRGLAVGRRGELKTDCYRSSMIEMDLGKSWWDGLRYVPHLQAGVRV